MEAYTKLEQVIRQVGEGAVRKSIPMGYKICRCDIHGAYLAAPDTEPTCPICPQVPKNNGTTATEVEHYINVDPAHMLGTNPQQKLNPTGI